MTRRSVAAWLFAVGCGQAPGNLGELHGTGTSTASGGSAGSSESGSTGSSSGGTGIKLDTPDGATDGVTDGSPGCEKADFLFVIDNSGSMQEEQANLVASFPGFIDAIQGTIQATDFHIMVADTDAETCCDMDPNNNCDGFDCSTLPAAPADACRNLLGAGVVHPWGNQASGMDCGIADGRRWMTETQPDLDATFACAATVGTSGWINAQQVEATLAAISPALTDAGQCNDGFLREDAILVVVLITDEDTSEGAPVQEWHDALVAEKNGDPEAVVMLGIVDDADDPMGTCQGGPGSPVLRQLIDSFPRSSFGSVCAPDFSPFLVDAVSVVDLTCDTFVPPG